MEKLFNKIKNIAMGVAMTGASLTATAENPHTIGTTGDPDMDTKYHSAEVAKFKPGLDAEINDKGEITSIKYVKLNEDGYIISFEQAGQLVSMRESGPIGENSGITYQKRDPKGNLLLSFGPLGKYKILNAGTSRQQEQALTTEEEKVIAEQIASLYNDEIKHKL